MVQRIPFRPHPIAIALIALLSSTGAAIAVEPPDTKARLLSDIAFQYAALGSADQSLEVLKQSLPLTRAMKSRCYQANPLAKVAGSYFLLGKEDVAKPLLTEAVRTAKAQDATGCSSSATSPTESLNNRAKEYAKAGHLDLAIDLNRQLGDPIAMAAIAGHLEAAGQSERATQLLDQAMTIAQATKSRYLPSNQLLLVMAEQMRAAKHPTLATRILQRSLESIPVKPPFPAAAEAQIPVLLQMATTFAGIQSNDQALTVLDRVLPHIQALPTSNIEKIRYQVQAASQYAALGRSNQSTKILAEALKNAESLPKKDDTFGRTDAIAIVAEGYAKLGDFEQALKIARSTEKVGGRILAYEKIAVAYAIAGKPDEAVKMAQLSGNRNGTLIAIVQYYLTQKQPDQALKFIQTHQVKGIASDVALGYLEAGQPEQALKVVQTDDLEGFIPEVARQAVQTGDTDKAWKLLREKKMEWILPDVARGFARKRQFDSALAVTKAINNRPEKVKALIAIAQSYTNQDSPKPAGLSGVVTNVGNWVQDLFGDSDRDQAMKALDQALEITRSL